MVKTMQHSSKFFFLLKSRIYKLKILNPILKADFAQVLVLYIINVRLKFKHYTIKCFV